jgi:hypothetical protein
VVLAKVPTHNNKLILRVPTTRLLIRSFNFSNPLALSNPLLLGAQASPPAAFAKSLIELVHRVAGGDACAPSKRDLLNAGGLLKGYWDGI